MIKSFMMSLFVLSASLQSSSVAAVSETITGNHLDRLTILETEQAQGIINPDFLALCYHDIRDDVRQDIDDDPMAVSTAHLLAHFEWLKNNDYAVVSLSDILDAQRGIRSLRKKAVLLTFDDGYASFYHKVFPLLRMYHYPAVVALVGKWLSYPESSLVAYGRDYKPRSHFLSWSQIKVLAKSPLIEFASHTYDMHRGVTGNPQENQQAAAVTRIYDVATHRYENDAAYRLRIKKDLAASQYSLHAQLGRYYRAIAWPYGRQSDLSTQLAGEAGMPLSLVLDRAGNRLTDLPIIRRKFIDRNPGLERFEAFFEPPSVKAAKRVVHLDLDYIYDTDAAQMRANLDLVVERIKRLRISAVYLQAFADADGDGNAQALYFPNRHLPVVADLFNRVAWQLKTRAAVAVYAWMPVSAFAVDAERYRQWGVYDHQAGRPQPSGANYQRLSIFQPGARQYILEIYEDLAKHTSFDGILFHDDAYLSDYEDVSPSAIAYYREHGFPHFDFDRVRADPQKRQRWARLKTDALIAFTKTLEAQVNVYRPRIKTARNLYARVITHPESEQWFAQNLSAFASAYDYTAIMAMPQLEGAEDPKQWLDNLVRKTARDVSLARVVFELQSVDWQNKTPIDNQQLVGQMRLVHTLGGINFGYYPDDFISDHPRLDVIKQAISLEDYHYTLRK